jgi:hypothetical protein
MCVTQGPNEISPLRIPLINSYDNKWIAAHIKQIEDRMVTPSKNASVESSLQGETQGYYSPMACMDKSIVP